MDEKKKKILKGVGIGVLALAVVGTAIGIGFSLSNKEKEPDEPIINTPVEPEPKPEPDPTPEPEPEPTPEPEPEPEPTPKPEPEPEPEPEPTPEPEPEPEPEPVQDREDMIFFDDTGELNVKGFHEALMEIVENFKNRGAITIKEQFIDRTFKDYDIVAVNWNQDEKQVQIYIDGELISKKHKNEREFLVLTLDEIDIKANKHENSLEKFIDNTFDRQIIPPFIDGEIYYTYSENDIRRMDSYQKAYDMAVYRMEQELGKNETVIASFLREKEEYPAGLDIGDNNMYYTSFLVLNEKTNELKEVPISVHSSSVLGGGSDKNLEDSPLEGSKYVVVLTNDTKDIVKIDPEYLYEVDGNKVSLLSAESDEEMLYTDNVKGYTAYLPKDISREL